MESPNIYANFKSFNFTLIWFCSIFVEIDHFKMAGKRLRVSDDAIKLVAHLYKVMCREKSQQNLVISLDRVFERLSNYVGLSRRCYDHIKEK